MPEWPIIDLSDDEILETCREWLPNKRCARTAVAIIWGDKFLPEALGPKCEEHFEYHVGRSIHDPQIHQWAIFDLRKLRRSK